MKHTYRKIDLGRPPLRHRYFGLAYIHTQRESLFIKGSVDAIQRHLSDGGLPFFGKIRVYDPHQRKVPYTRVISGNGLLATFNKIGIRTRDARLLGYKFISDKYCVTLKTVRRFPTRWLQELNVLFEVDSHILAGVDYLLDHGFELSATVLRAAYYEANGNKTCRKLYGFD